MVTAILIPIICFYFYWVTRKDMKENEEKWLSLNQLIEEAIVSGEILQIVESKKRFYYHRFIQVIDIHLLTETKTIQVSRVTPFTKNMQPISLKVGELVRLYGNWQENQFRFLKFEIITEKEKETELFK
ncbi:hypothetical protein ACFSO7_05275 [Bacillus sp. CGMCC 1.16607]|uniref:hypothetical protein n=1 Tax=Bacillus sp. CGMCC 1.16607 TaxID=3351842 RepID=UPI003633ABAA